MNIPNRTTLAGILALFILTFAAYGPALNGGFIWDDDDYVSENVLLDEPDALSRIWGEPGATPQYYPVVFTTFWLEAKLWSRGDDGSLASLNTFGFHFANVLLHTLSALLIWRVLRKLALPGAWFVAAVFALHPVHVESVAWITERKNVLSGVLYLAAFLAYLRFCKIGEQAAASAVPDETVSKKEQKRRAAKQANTEEPRASRTWPFYLLAAVLFAGALLSKSVTASLPASLLLVLYWKRGVKLNDVLLLVPFFIMGITAGSHTAEIEREVVFRFDADLGVDGLEHLLVAGRAIWFYAGKLLMPVNLTFMYPRWDLDIASFVQWLYPLLAGGALFVTWVLRNRIGRGPLVALLFFGGTLIPALGFVDVFPMYYSFVADHFQYLASLGVITLIVGVGTTLILRVSSPKVGLGIGSVLVATLAVTTWNQCHDYRDLRTLWHATLERNPGAIMAAINLSNQVVREDDDLEEAIRILEQALAAVPPGTHPTVHARAHYNYANNLGNDKQYDKAMANYTRAYEIAPVDYRKALIGLGWAQERLGNTSESLVHYERYLDLLRKLNQNDPEIRGRVKRLKAKL